MRGDRRAGIDIAEWAAARARAPLAAKLKSVEALLERWHSEPYPDVDGACGDELRAALKGGGE